MAMATVEDARKVARELALPQGGMRCPRCGSQVWPTNEKGREGQLYCGRCGRYTAKVGNVASVRHQQAPPEDQED